MPIHMDTAHGVIGTSSPALSHSSRAARKRIPNDSRVGQATLAFARHRDHRALCPVDGVSTIAARVAHITACLVDMGRCRPIGHSRCAPQEPRGAEDDAESTQTQMPPRPRAVSGLAPASTLNYLSRLFWLTKAVALLVLLLLDGARGMVLAAQGLPQLTVVVVVLCVWGACIGGAGSINHGLEGHIDSGDE